MVCLQEVDEGVGRSGRDSQLQRLSRELGYPFAALGLNVRVGHGGYGSATLSRLPMWDVHNVDLTVPLKKRRSALVTRIEQGPPGGWVIANVHLGLLHLERRVQVRRLLAHVTEGHADDRPVVLAGDWNEWGSRLVQGALRDAGFTSPGSTTTLPRESPPSPAVDRSWRWTACSTAARSGCTTCSACSTRSRARPAITCRSWSSSRRPSTSLTPDLGLR